MPPRTRRARVHDPVKTRAALLAQAAAVRDAVAGLDPAALALPTRLPGWTVRDLAGHVASQVEALHEAPPGRPEQGAADPAARLASAVAALERAPAGPPADPTLRVPPGSTTAAGLVVGRLVELTVHADDLAAATGAAVPLDRQALASTVRVLADALAERAPGNAVEVRVPPFAAVQCLPGPRHTRGTPPNVVETDPVTWLRLATGRVAWAAALADAAVSASGERADLTGYLPVPGRPLCVAEAGLPGAGPDRR
ncbi:sterol carrier family protein [Streptomyces sp. SL13]|uniref:Sterol carrier family protein n=1 Tax=Streptantibioticus silvisoli TaxID=2705255 RepID=A0AA90H5N2_9ACTN|nr:maleylpyruvate isomerase family mycothiol-dependent enzyme [Streptantibioticus silvisoli]MDI5971305.1 sterol carrier family protein [Streptantibioticus silvisoli]